MNLNLSLQTVHEIIKMSKLLKIFSLQSFTWNDFVSENGMF